MLFSFNCLSLFLTQRGLVCGLWLWHFLAIVTTCILIPIFDYMLSKIKINLHGQKYKWWPRKTVYVLW